MDTPAGPDPDINIGGEETGIEIRDALLGLRMEMRAMHQHLAVELDEMRKMRAAQRREFGWLVGLYVAGAASLLAVVAYRFKWL
jgi:hypothetical protein